jgi:hypothetical protein
MLCETQPEKGQILKKLSRHEAARTQTLYSSLENNRTEIHLKLTPTELRLNANYGGFQLLDLIIMELKSHMTC